MRYVGQNDVATPGRDQEATSKGQARRPEVTGNVFGVSVE